MSPATLSVSEEVYCLVGGRRAAVLADVFAVTEFCSKT